MMSHWDENSSEVTYEREARMSKVRKFIGILTVELADMQEDLAVLIAEAERKRNEERYTEYVLKENCALYKSEIDALKDISGEIASRGLESSDSVETAIESILGRIPTLIREKDYPAYTFDLVARKIEKIRRFVEME